MKVQYVRKSTLLYFVSAALVFCAGDGQPPPPANPPCQKPQLEVMVSPVKKRIQIYWNFPSDIHEGWIGVYSEHPDFNDPGKHRVTDPIKIDKRMGWSITDIKSWDNTGVDLKYDVPTYLGFFACAWRKNNGKDEALIVSDLRTYPRWMEHYWEYIKLVPINKIFLPGTHDSGSFEGHHEKCSFWKRSIKAMPIVKDWSYAQDSTIKEQLLLGIRYLDVRLRRDSDEYWTCHGGVVMQKLDAVIADVVEFVSKTSKEIVIIDVHQLVSGIESEEEHRALATHFKEKLSLDKKPLYVNPNDFGQTPWLATPEAISAKGRIILSYVNVEFQRKDNCGILWPKVHQYWADKQSMNELQKYILETIQGRTQRKDFTTTLTAVMAQLTGNGKQMLAGIGEGLNDQAQENDGRIQELFLDSNLALETNVLTVDYFRSSGIVRLAFMWNERKFFKTNCDPPEKFSDDYYQKILIVP